MGVFVIAALALYLLISIGVVVWAIRYARKYGKSATRWGLGAALVMYLIPFWDWLPTMAAHQYYCVKESGFWIYKTVEQWKIENPGVMETLKANEPPPLMSQGDERHKSYTYSWNQRFQSVVEKAGPFLMNVWRHEQRILDVKTGEVVAKRLDFSTGDGYVGGEPQLRFWMRRDHCPGGREEAIEFARTVKKFRGTKG